MFLFLCWVRVKELGFVPIENQVVEPANPGATWTALVVQGRNLPEISWLFVLNLLLHQDKSKMDCSLSSDLICRVA